ncbi:hypothetical protein K3169_07915 [Pseudomonas phytophila]|uniref:Uncharacterized protein n=2 Tax=Pseudomonas TaxID=286 RepID=A0ABY6FIY7_9PSED|nr:MULTISPECIES: hypothetical protein [Pseudomonas]MCD5991019.1 hypothetical protein [Pseudomonas quasicaspiana]MDG6399773.1 hypothetical protein [Pseudomonas quasicaspiana]UXZ97799.1 hypothetical protein K3169_07915 [Pseudomonas phytophila]
MKSIRYVPLLLGLAVFPGLGFAGNPILDSLEEQYFGLERLGDEKLAKLKGTRLIADLSMPSVTTGMRYHYVSWKKFGNKGDYRSYNYLGDHHDNRYGFTYKWAGFAEPTNVAGDKWMADTSGNAQLWNKAQFEMVEYHYQVLDKNTRLPRELGFRESRWNRPMSTFRW